MTRVVLSHYMKHQTDRARTEHKRERERTDVQLKCASKACENTSHALQKKTL